MYSMNPVLSTTAPPQSNANVLKISTLLDELEFKRLLQQVQTHLEEGCLDFVLDLSELKVMNSVGLNFLISVLNRSNQSGSHLTLFDPTPTVIRLMEITKLKSLFNIKYSSSLLPELAPPCGSLTQAAA